MLAELDLEISLYFWNKWTADKGIAGDIDDVVPSQLKRNQDSEL